MAFAQLRKPTRSFSGRLPSDSLTLSVTKPKGGKTTQSTFSIPREILREAGVPDYPGATIDLLVGSGTDAGSVAIIPGSRYKLGLLGAKTSQRVVFRASILATAAFPAASVEYEAGRKQLIIHLPPGFPLAAEAELIGVGAPAPRYGAVIGQAIA